MARAAADHFGLTRVLMIPSARPPHRRDGPFAGYEDRFRMLELACQGEPRLIPSRLEDGPGVSYSIDTIERVLAAGEDQPLWFLIGADAFAEIRSWRRWEAVVAAVRFIVVSRPGANYEIPPGAVVERLEDMNLPVSSSEIRRQLAQGLSSPDVPAAVSRYISDHCLYRQ